MLNSLAARVPSLPDTEDLAGRSRFDAEQFMALGLAEGRKIDARQGIIGHHDDMCASLDFGKRAARQKHRQRAFEPDGIDPQRR